MARYLRDRDLQREINEGLNVVESWNRANAVIFFGKGGDIATNRTAGGDSGTRTAGLPSVVVRISKECWRP